MEINELIEALERHLENPSKGLPEQVFLFLSRISPLVNVDLLIKDEAGRTLLAWRDDAFHEPGWHVPGGIIRFKETAAARIAAVAAAELGATVVFKDKPTAINEIIFHDRDTRSHFISLLYECTLATAPAPELRCCGGQLKAGQWAWHEACPDDLLAVQKIYTEYI